MMDQYHLAGGARFSNRAVRVQALDSNEVADNLSNAARIIEKDATVIDLKKTEYRNGLSLFIKEISEPTDDPFGKDVKWQKVQAPDFDMGLSQWFTAKDVQVLEAIYKDYHEVTKDTLDLIMGKGKAVTAG